MKWSKAVRNEGRSRDTRRPPLKPDRAGEQGCQTAPAYRMVGDAPQLALIRWLVDKRPTYGYLRITRLVNQLQKAECKPNIKAKRLLRIMRTNQLTLERHTGWRRGHTHEGIVIAERSRFAGAPATSSLAAATARSSAYCSPSTPAIGRSSPGPATTPGISGGMVRDLMVACVEPRFDISRPPQTVECLSDNGSAYIAKSDTATPWVLNLCLTPVRSRVSNGVAEAFAKIFKRDYARLSILPNAATVSRCCRHSRGLH